MLPSQASTLPYSVFSLAGTFPPVHACKNFTAMTVVKATVVNGLRCLGVNYSGLRPKICRPGASGLRCSSHGPQQIEQTEIWYASITLFYADVCFKQHLGHTRASYDKSAVAGWQIDLCYCSA